MGQLWLGDDQTKFERKRPALVEAIENVVDIRVGGMHNLVLTHEGVVYSFGCNDEYALGCDSKHSPSLHEDGRVFTWGSFCDSHGIMGLTIEGYNRLPIDVLQDTICCDFASGADHLCNRSCQ